MKGTTRDGLGKGVDNLVTSRNMLDKKMMFLNMISNIVDIESEMFGFWMKNGISSEENNN